MSDDDENNIFVQFEGFDPKPFSNELVREWDVQFGRSREGVEVYHAHDPPFPHRLFEEGFAMKNSLIEEQKTCSSPNGPETTGLKRTRPRRRKRALENPYLATMENSFFKDYDPQTRAFVHHMPKQFKCGWSDLSFASPSTSPPPGESDRAPMPARVPDKRESSASNLQPTTSKGRQDLGQLELELEAEFEKRLQMKLANQGKRIKLQEDDLQMTKKAWVLPPRTVPVDGLRTPTCIPKSSIDMREKMGQEDRKESLTTPPSEACGEGPSDSIKDYVRSGSSSQKKRGHQASQGSSTRSRKGRPSSRRRDEDTSSVQNALARLNTYFHKAWDIMEKIENRILLRQCDITSDAAETRAMITPNLATIKRKVDELSYSSKHDFFQDVNLLFTNVVQVFGPENVYSISAKKMHIAAQKYLLGNQLDIALVESIVEAEAKVRV